MKNNSNLIYALFLILGDFLALLAAFGVAYILRVKLDDRPLIETIPASTYLQAFLIVLPFWIAIQASIGLYSRSVYENRFREFGRLILGSFLGILVIIGYDFIVDDAIFPARLVAVYGLLLGFGFLVIFRVTARLLRTLLFSYNVGVDNVLIIGSSKSSEGIVEELINTKRSGYRIIGFVGFEINDHSVPAYENFDEAIKKLRRKNIHSIIQTKLYADEVKNEDILLYAQTHHIAYRFMPGNDGVFAGNIEVELFRGTPLVTVHQTALVGWGRIIKRLFDIVVGSLFFIFLSPLMIISAILMKIMNPRETIFFSQMRLTQFDRPFKVYKFRSQYKKYDNTTPEQAFEIMGKPELAKKYRANGDSIDKDPRTIKLGHFLRVTSIDELPQLINVIKGDISLVGPRALIPEELEKYQLKHHILSVRSGLTGLAQVSGRRQISFEDRRKLDVYYVQNWSFWLDLTILLKTLRAVINGIGAK